MTRTLFVILWLAVMITVVGATHFYIWARLVRDVSMPLPWRRLATGALIFMALSVPAAFFVVRMLSGPVAKVAAATAFGWMGIFFITLVCLGAMDLLRVAIVAAGKLAARLGAHEDLWDPQRRLFLARALAGTTAVVVGGLSAAAARAGTRVPGVRRVTVALARLPRALEGLKIAQLTDLHVSVMMPTAHVRAIVEQANALEPDVVAITGDLVDGPVASLRHKVAPLASLRARYGVFFVTGNHEYYSGLQDWVAELARLGIRVLRNERVAIGPPDSSIDLAGIDDSSAHRFGLGHGADLGRALAGRDPRRELILLAHQPKAIVEAAEQGVGLLLAGHTHGGQIWPFGYLVALAQPYVAGLARHGQTWIYVSRGTGCWGPPMRLGAPAEITLVRLQAGPDERPQASVGAAATGREA